jgi:peptide chain release factor 3
MLQFEVLEYRMKSEYGVDITVENLPYLFARWVTAEKVTKDMLGYIDSAVVVEDQYHRPVILFKDQWTLNRAIEKNKGIEFLDIPPSA